MNIQHTINKSRCRILFYRMICKWFGVYVRRFDIEKVISKIDHGHEIAIDIYMSYGHVASYVYIDNEETKSKNMYVGGNPYTCVSQFHG